MTILLITLLLFLNPGSTEYTCANQIEIRCTDEKCTAAQVGEFTPMSVSFDNKGNVSVCAYSGCWEGVAKAIENDRFLFLSGNDLPFSTAPESKQSISISLDKNDNIALLKAGEFAQPVVCSIKK